MKTKLLKEGELLGWKILPGDGRNVAEIENIGNQNNKYYVQSEKDWSALYAQFSVDHAVAYLPNHYDRGCSIAMLVRIKMKKDLMVAIVDDELMKDSEAESSKKSEKIREILNLSKDSSLTKKPLLQTIGEELKMALVIYDCEDMECVIPHCLFNHEYFNFEPVCVFKRNEETTWQTECVTMVTDNEELKLSRLEKEDVRKLAILVKTALPVSCVEEKIEWFQ